MLQELWEKIKSRENEIFLVLGSILVSLTVVGGVRFWTLGNDKVPLEFQKHFFQASLQARVADESATSSVTTAFVASKNGTKYYPSDCASAKRIKDENKLFFTSEDEAKKAGYERTVQCK